MPRSPASTVWTSSTCPITAAGSSITGAARPTCCRKSSRPLRAARASSWTARSSAAPTWSRRSRSAPIWWAWAACRASASPPPPRPAACASWSCSRTRSASRSRCLACRTGKSSTRRICTAVRPSSRCRASRAPSRSWTSRATELPGEDLRPELRDPILHDEHRLDAVEPPRVVAEQFLLHRLRHAELRHRLQRFPHVLGVVVRIIRRPDADVRVEIPHAVDRNLVALERDEAPAIEGLGGIGDRPLSAALKRVEVEEIPAPAEHHRQPRGVGLEHRALQPRKLLEPAGHQYCGEPRHRLHDEAERLTGVDRGLHGKHDVADELAG